MKKYIRGNSSPEYVLFELEDYSLRHSRLSELGEQCINEAIEQGDLLIVAQSEEMIFSEELYYLFAIRKGANSNIEKCLEQMYSVAGFIVPMSVTRSNKGVKNFKLL